MAQLPPSRPTSVQACGFSLFELILVVGIVAVLATLATQRLTVARMQAERVSMESILGNLRSALGIRVAEELGRGNQAQIVELAGSNPFDRIAELPDTYRGAFFGVDPALFEGGLWYFDTRDKTLIYRVRFDSFFQTPLPGPARARFAVVLVYDDVDQNQQYDQGIDRLAGVRLQALETYRWLDSDG